MSWGDSRIGNMPYDGLTPVAVLDCVMAAIAPREVVLAWMVSSAASSKTSRSWLASPASEGIGDR